ncbi:MAG: aquaporin [Actinobacteria bacterium]|nr:aquaporin [Actinomycetota bacterium]
MQIEGRKLLAELVGTFALTFIGSMSAAMAVEGFGGGGGAGVAVAALGHGLILTVMVYALGGISGCHINPAVTLALAVAGKFPRRGVVPYLIAQLAGGTLAGLFHKWVRPLGPSSFGATLPAPDVADGTVVLLEAVLTFFLVTAVFGAAVSKKAPAGFHGLAIGFALGASILAGGAITGASLNPARSFGPALASLNFTAHWAYWVGPIVGGLVAAVVALVVQDFGAQRE